MVDDEADPRQRVVRVPGARRARLTPVAGTDADPDTAGGRDARPRAASDRKGPNDDRLIQDVPPHY